LALVTILVGCGEAPEQVLTPSARPVKSIVVEAPQGGGVRNFPGRIESANRADLAFRVGGKIAELVVQEGARVEREQVLARLDETDFRITLKDRRATYDRASKDFERGKELVAKGAISRRDFDAVDANFKTAAAALEQATQNLDYTYIRAPFAGEVSERHADVFEEVAAGQKVYSVIDRDALEVQIDVPEDIILALPSKARTGETEPDIEVWASFDAAPGRQFDLRFKEVSTRADAQTQTFQVTFSLPRPKDVTVLPGMTASVAVDLSKVVKEQAVYYLPLSAVVGDNHLAARVWIVNEEQMTVHERPVKVGRMVGSRIEVTEGLEPGLRVITAGAAYLSEDMEVTLMRQSEQAQPRVDSVKSGG
jgi:RND family efflux transporter MFP subunit